MPKPVRKKPKLVLLRNSERGVFKECRQRWHWSYNDGLVRKGSDHKALVFGTLVHEAFAEWYIPGPKRGVHPAETFRLLYEAYLNEGNPELIMIQRSEDEDAIDALMLGVDMLTHYVEFYGDEEDSCEMVAPEMPCQVDVHDPETDEYLFTYVFKMDGVGRELRYGKLFLWEHKTSASAEKPGTPVQLDEQGRSYWTFGEPWLMMQGYLGPDEEIDFLRYNILRKAMRDTRPTNEQGQFLNKPTKERLLEHMGFLGEVVPKSTKVEDLRKMLEKAGVNPDALGDPSKSQPPPYFNRVPIYVTEGERLTMLNRVIAEFKEMQMVRNGELSIIKNPGQHCNGCPFRDMCELHESGDDWQTIKEEMYVVRDPYADHADMDRSFE